MVLRKGLRVVSVLLCLVGILWLSGAFVPSWAIFEETKFPAGLPFSLSFRAQGLVYADLDGDGLDECALLVWKRGSYGRHRPRWVKLDEPWFSQHIFIYKLREDGWHAVWMSSRLGIEVSRLLIGDAIKGTGRTGLTAVLSDGERVRFGWLSWGLVRL